MFSGDRYLVQALSIRFDYVVDDAKIAQSEPTATLLLIQSLCRASFQTREERRVNRHQNFSSGRRYANGGDRKCIKDGFRNRQFQSCI
ncbi:hypothetical protein H1Q63_33150 [Desmonostoc muscorum CCALA 125]|nr:hypothetical protein [Desmonostoc muscorum CCALA 125]